MRSGLQEVEFDYRLNDRSRATVVDGRHLPSGVFEVSHRNAQAQSTASSAAKGCRQQDSVTDGPSEAHGDGGAGQRQRRFDRFRRQRTQCLGHAARRGAFGAISMCSRGGRDEGGC